MARSANSRITTLGRASMTLRKAGWVLAAVLLVAPAIAAQNKANKGTVRCDGSSTVAPITMAAAEMFQEVSPSVNVNVGISGTGAGFKKFLDANTSLRTDVCDASRPIEAGEAQIASKLG